MIEKIRAFVEKHWDMVSYLFFGVLTTAVNYLVYLPLYNLLGRKYLEADYQRSGGHSELRLQQAAGLPQVSVSPLPNGNGGFFNRSAP